MYMWRLAAKPHASASSADGAATPRSLSLSKETGEAVISLSLAHYDAIGGLQNALSRRLDKLYGRLEPAQKTIAETMFRCLSERGEGQRDTRRPAPIAEIARVAGCDWQEVATVAEVFRAEGRNFLMPPPGVALAENTVLDISHESLIRQWDALQDWLNDEADKAEMLQRLAEAAQRRRDGRGDLWIGLDLAAGLAWREKHRPTAAWAARYLKNSVGGGFSPPTREEAGVPAWAPQKDAVPTLQSALEFLDASDLAQRRAKRRKAQLLVGVMLTLALAAGFMFVQWQRALEAEQRAIRHADIARQQKQIALNAVNRRTYEYMDELGQIPRAAPTLRRMLTHNIELLEQLYALNPNDSATQREKSVNLDLTGDALMKYFGDTQAALDAYQESLKISRQIAQNDPGSSQAQRDLSVSLNKLGDINLQLGNSQAALDAYQESLKIRRQIAQNDPGSSQAQRDLLVSFYKQGQILSKLERPQEALEFYRQALEIAEKAVAQDSLNATAQNDLKTLQGLVLGLQVQLKQFDAARTLIEQLDNVEAWNVFANVLWRENDLSGAAAAFARGIEKEPENPSLLTNDLELAFAQEDKQRGQQRLAALRPLLQADNPLYAIVPFYAWLLEPEQKPAAVLAAIEALPEEMTFGWDFSTTEPALSRLPEAAQKTARDFIAFFKGEIGREALRWEENK
jgi:tetratricopeptide (TPR) repeat protein